MDIIEINPQTGTISTTNRDTIFNILKQEFKNIYGENAYIEKGTEDYNMISLLADLLSDMGNVAVSAGNALSLTNATGIQLDNLASIYYGTFSRKPATYSTVEVTLTGDSGTRIVNGQVRDSYGGIWNLESPVTIPNAGVYTCTATYSETGAYYIEAGQIDGASAIATPVAGWNSVSQPNACNIGRDVETDASFRARIAQRSRGTAVSTLSTLQSNLLSLVVNNQTPITSVKIYVNDEASSSEVVTGLTIPSHSIAVIVYTGSTITVNTDLSRAIADTIYNYKATGTGTYGSLTQVITNSQGQAININFTPGTSVPLKFDVQLRKLVATAPDLTDSAIEGIQNAIKARLGEYSIGDTIYAQDFYYSVTQAIAQVLDVTQYNINTITISLDNGTTYVTSIALDYNEVGVVNIADIEVDAT